MSDCRYPQHHKSGPAGAMQLVALLVVVGTVAIVVTHWRAVVACIVVTGVVLVLAAVLMTLARNHARYYDPELERQAALERAHAQQALPAASPAVAAAPATMPALDAAPVVSHQHLHLHGLTGAEMTAVVRKAIGPAGTGEPR